MSSNTIALLVVMLYMVALISISFYAKHVQNKKAAIGKSGESFLLANRSFGPVLVMVTIIGVALGANGTVGIAQNAYVFGISAGWYDGAFSIGIMITAFLFVKKLRSLKLNTISQIYGDYYGEKTRIISSIGQLFMNFCIMVAQYIAGGAILSSLLPQYFTLTTGMILSAVIFLAIASIGGMMSTGITNIVNVGLLYISVILAVVFTLNGVGGWHELVRTVPDQAVFLHPINGLSVGVFISYLMIFFFNVPTGQSTVQMIFAAKDDKSAFRGYLLGGLMVLPFGFATATIGMAARVLFPTLENTALALPSVIMTFPGIVAGIVLSGMWAADVSTGTSLILGNSALFINDIYKPLRKKTTALDEAKLSKIIGVIFTILTLYCAFYVKFLLKFITMSLSLSVAYFIILIASLYFPRLCKRSSAMTTLLASFIVVTLWMTVPAFNGMFSHVVYPQLIVCFIVFFLTALLDKKPAKFRETESFRAQAVLNATKN